MEQKAMVTDALHEIFSLVVTGVDYASEIAKKTGKSIPVVFKQLDQLMNLGLIAKVRDGKKVIYTANWNIVSKSVAHSLFKDLNNYKTYLSAKDQVIDKEVEAEIKALLKTLPENILVDEKEMEKVVNAAFSRDGIRLLFKEFLLRFFAFSKQIYSMTEISFTVTLDYFLDIFGALDAKKQKEFIAAKLKAPSSSELALFMKICRLRYLQKKASDPILNFFKK